MKSKRKQNEPRLLMNGHYNQKSTESYQQCPTLGTERKYHENGSNKQLQSQKEEHWVTLVDCDQI